MAAPSATPRRRRRSGRRPCAASLLLLLRPRSVRADGHVPFGYQSDSTRSVEYRASARDGGAPRTDPSSYAGAVRYDPRHHALYVTGATFGAAIFDGADAGSGAQGAAQGAGGTGPRPHPGDVGVPDHAPAAGDCFYAVLGLPPPGEDAGDGGDADDDSSVKLVHSRRFGSAAAGEACSALDVAFASPRPLLENRAPGFADGAFSGALSPAPTDGAAGQPGPGGAGRGAAAALPTYLPTASSGPTTSPAPTYDPTPSRAPAPTYGPSAQATPTATYAPTATTRPSEAPAPTYRPTGRAPEPSVAEKVNTGPQARRRALRPDGRGRGTGERRDRARGAGRRRRAQAPVPTRSVRLLMAGHVESPSRTAGYLLDDLPAGGFDQHKVYAFAQQVDVRLPFGDLDEGADYHLHKEGMEEDAFAQEFGEFMGGGSPGKLPKEQFKKIVTSGVESRALLNEGMPPSLDSVYPVALVADPTTKKHYYTVMLASDDPDKNMDVGDDALNADPTVGQGASQRAWTDFATSPGQGSRTVDGTADNFGTAGRANYGKNYRIVVRKMSLESGLDAAELTDTDKALGSESYEGERVAMQHTWTEEFEPDAGEDLRPSGLLFAPSGDAKGAGDMLVLVGNTAGRGSAFGTAGGDAARDDLDGFVTKLRADRGTFVGHDRFDTETNSFVQTHSKRIRSEPGHNEIVAGVCAQPLRKVGKQDEMTHIYVVGSTSALLEGVAAGVRSEAFLAHFPTDEAESSTPMEAFLMKIELKTMDILWTVQVGAAVAARTSRGTVFGYGCTVTADGEDVYLSGLVKADGVATDFSQLDLKNWESGQSLNVAAGGTDVFVASYRTRDGARVFLRQLGSTRDDFPSRGQGGLATDREGNAILAGSTRGSLMRQRDGGEYRYGLGGEDAAADVFVLSLERGTSRHLPVMHDGVDAIPGLSLIHVKPTVNSLPKIDKIGSGADTTTKNGGLLGAVSLFLALLFLVAGVYAAVVYSAKRKNKEREVVMEVTNLRGNGHRTETRKTRRKSTWGIRSKSSTMDNFRNLNVTIGLEVRNSASGGWHGVYDDEQLQAINFGAPDKNEEGGAGFVNVRNSDSGGWHGIYSTDDELLSQDNIGVVAPDGSSDIGGEGLDGLKEIEDGLLNYEIGDMDEDVSDEDLIKAYNDAMALDIEPESEDVEFAMQGIGSIS